MLPGAVAMVGATISTDGYDVIWGDPASRVALVGVIAALGFAGEAREPWAIRPGTERMLPSARARVA